MELFLFMTLLRIYDNIIIKKLKKIKFIKKEQKVYILILEKWINKL